MTSKDNVEAFSRTSRQYTFITLKRREQTEHKSFCPIHIVKISIRNFVVCTEIFISNQIIPDAIPYLIFTFKSRQYRFSAALSAYILYNEGRGTLANRMVPSYCQIQKHNLVSNEARTICMG